MPRDCSLRAWRRYSSIRCSMLISASPSSEQPGLRRDLDALGDARQKEARLLALVLEVRVLLALRDLEQRRLRDVEVAALDDFRM